MEIWNRKPVVLLYGHGGLILGTAVGHPSFLYLELMVPNTENGERVSPDPTAGSPRSHPQRTFVRNRVGYIPFTYHEPRSPDQGLTHCTKLHSKEKKKKSLWRSELTIDSSISIVPLEPNGARHSLSIQTPTRNRQHLKKKEKRKKSAHSLV